MNRTKFLFRMKNASGRDFLSKKKDFWLRKDAFFPVETKIDLTETIKNSLKMFVVLGLVAPKDKNVIEVAENAK